MGGQARRELGVYYKRSTNEGVSWGSDTRLTNAWLCYPSVAVSGSVVHVVWQGDFQGEDVIYHERSTESGVSWSSETQLTNAAMTSWLPSVAVSGSVVHVVWYDNRDGNDEIYYKRDPTGNVVKLKYIGSELPDTFKLYQNHPNPFNTETSIKFDIPVSSFVRVSIFDPTGREIDILVNQKLSRRLISGKMGRCQLFKWYIFLQAHNG